MMWVSLDDIGYCNILCSARVACGVEVILGAFSRGTKRPLKELHVLDAGIFSLLLHFCSYTSSVILNQSAISVMTSTRR